MGINQLLHTYFKAVVSSLSERLAISLLCKALKILDKLIPKLDVFLKLPFQKALYSASTLIPGILPLAMKVSTLVVSFKLRASRLQRMEKNNKYIGLFS